LREGVKANRGRKIDVQAAPFPEARGARVGAMAAAAGAAAPGGIVRHGAVVQTRRSTRRIQPAPKPVPAVAAGCPFQMSTVNIEDGYAVAAVTALSRIGVQADIAPAAGALRHVHPAPGAL